VNFHVDGEAIFVVPNDAASKVLNPLGGSIAVALRGNNSFAEKAKIVQEAGALGLLIIDYLGPSKDVTSSSSSSSSASSLKSAWCTELFECGGWLGSRDYGNDENDESDNVPGQKQSGSKSENQKKFKYMGAGEDPALWRDIRIPVLFLTNRQGERLRSLMDVNIVTIDGESHMHVPE
jgi:hypothetical protein